MIGIIILLALYVLLVWPMYSRIHLGEEVEPSIDDFKNQLSSAVEKAREDW